MASSPVVSTPPVTSSPALEYSDEHLSELVDQSGPNSAVRGIVTGMLLGAVLWGGILVLTGVVKL